MSLNNNVLVSKALDVRQLMAVNHAEDVLAGLSRRDRFSRITTITSFHYLYVTKDKKGKPVGEASLQDSIDFLTALSFMKYNGVSICTILNDNQIEWNFELTSVVKSLKSPTAPDLQPLPVKLEIRRPVAKRTAGRPKKAKRGRPPGSKNIIQRKMEAVKGLRTVVEMKKSGMVGFFLLPADRLDDKDLAGKVQKFLKTMG